MIRTKLLAVTLGVNGFGIYSQVLNFLNITNFLIPLGTPLGIIRYVADKESLGEKTNPVFNSVILLISCIAVIITIVLIIFSSEISYLLFNTSDFSPLLIVASITIPFSIVSMLYDAYVKGLQLINVFVKITIISSISSLIITIPLVLFYGINGALLSILLAPIIFSVLSIIKLKNLRNIFFTIKDLSFCKGSMNEILKIGLASLITGSLLQISLLICRIITIDNLGIEANGIFQSVLSISQNYFGIIFTSMAIYSLPKFSSISENSELVLSINENLRFIVFLIVPLIIFFYVFREYVISLLYTNEFQKATDLFSFQFLGDFFKATGWIIGLWLIARKKTIIWIILDIIYSINLISIYYLVLNNFVNDITALSISYCITNLIHLVLNLLIIMKLLDFKLSGLNFKLIFISLSLILLVYALNILSPFFSVILIIPLFLIWLYSVTSNEERTKTISILKNYLKT